MFQWDARALEILNTLERAGHQAVLVGGCVRDALLGREPHDYDAAVSAPPEEILAASKFKCIPTGLAHGTVTVVHSGLPVEVTAFRKEGTYSDHRHPDRVEYTSRLEEDLARRDFTVNAMAWDRSGLIDPFGGQADLAAGVIRCVGEPDRRFQEDALRVLRGLRLAAQLDFRLEGETAAAIRRNTPLLSYVAWERIQAEFLRLLCCPGAERILLDFPETVCQIVPELTPAVGFDQKNPHHCYDVYTHSVKALGRVRPEPALRLAALLHDGGKPACFSLDGQGVGHFYGHEGESARLAEQAAARLRLDKGTQERVVTLVARHGLQIEASPRVVRRWLQRLGPDLFFDLLELERADGMACAPRPAPEPDRCAQAETMAREILAQKPCLTLKELAVNGRDALAAGLSGPAVGRALNRLLDQRIMVIPLLCRSRSGSFRRPSQRRNASSTAGLKMEKSSP